MTLIMKSNQIKCLVVDDQEIFRMIIKKIMNLDTSLVLVGECASATEAYEMIQKYAVDVVFLDIEMPGLSGLELTQVLNGKGPLIILITSRIDMVTKVFDLNVVDFLTKPILPVSFFKAVEKVKIRLN
jgi:two-component system LytT family response regulator